MRFYFFRSLLLLGLVPIITAAQLDEVLAQPSLTLSWKSPTRWNLTTTVEQRNIVKTDVAALHLQAAQFVSYELGFYSQLGVGIMYRELFDDERPEELRLTEQYVYTRKYNTFKVAHRGRLDQRFRGDRTTHRLRYRLSSSIPLNGERTDKNEYYLTGHLETLLITEQDIAPGYDQRFALGLGRQLGKNLKLQLVVEYRIEDYTSESERLLFLNFGLYYAL